MIERGGYGDSRTGLIDRSECLYQVFYIQVYTRVVKGFTEEETIALRNVVYNTVFDRLVKVYRYERLHLLLGTDLFNTGIFEFYIGGSYDRAIVSNEQHLVNIVADGVNRHIMVVRARGKRIAKCNSLNHCKSTVDVIYNASLMFDSTTIH